MSESGDGLTPAEYRARYGELMRRAHERAAGFAEPAANVAPGRIPDGAILVHETIAPGWYWSAVVPRGTTLRVVNASATAGVAAFCWNADDTSERYCLGDTVKIQWTVRLQTGRLLLSDMGRVLFSVTSDTSGRHDTLLGGTSRGSAVDLPHRNTRDNLLIAAGKHGLGKRDIAPFLTLFAHVEINDAGSFSWRTQPKRDTIELRAEMNVLVALSNTPHPLSGEREAAGPVEAIVWRSPPPLAADRCRTATDEALRAFENTAAERRVWSS